MISDKWDEIAPTVLNKLHRGVTYISAEGAYTGKQRKLVYCIVKTVELAPLKRIVKEHDEYAMISVIDTREVSGRGFGALN
ncbi:MAG: YitT family protein [Clostridia bacterium]